MITLDAPDSKKKKEKLYKLGASSAQQRTSPFCPPPSNASLNNTETLTLFLCASRLCTLVFVPLLNTVHHLSLSLSLPPYRHGWVEARVKQGFVFNDVPHSRHDGLVQEDVAQHPAAPAPHGLHGAGEAELGGAHVQTLGGPHSLLAVLCQSARRSALAAAGDIG